MKDGFVSVIVPAYRDWERLALCVEALSKQSYPRALFEVIIVNNDPNDPPPPHFTLPAGFRLLTEAKVGSYAARNAALKVAKGSIIGFTDADCIPDTKWIEHAVQYLIQNSSCSRVTGPVQVFTNSSRTTIAELYDQTYAFPQKMYVEKGCCVTANLFTYRYLFDRVGFFDENLLSTADYVWGIEANKAGYQIHYVENIVIKHPARNLAALIKKERRKGGGKGMAERNLNNKLLNFMRLLNGFRPRFAEIKFINKATNLPVADKIKVLLLRHYLLNVRAFEHLRVQMGKAPNRA